LAQLQWDNNQYAYAKKDTNEEEAIGEKILNLSLKEIRTEEAIAERENKLKELGFTINNDGTNQQLEITQEQKRLDTEGATNQSQEEQFQI